jgi:hypothetical protein
MLCGKLTNSFMVAAKPFVRKLHQRRSMQNSARTPTKKTKGLNLHERAALCVLNKFTRPLGAREQFGMGFGFGRPTRTTQRLLRHALVIFKPWRGRIMSRFFNPALINHSATAIIGFIKNTHNSLCTHTCLFDMVCGEEKWEDVSGQQKHTVVAE